MKHKELIMAGNRKKAEALILKFVGELDLSGYNTEKYKKVFAEMSDKTFHDWMVKIRAGEAQIIVFKPLYEGKITTENNLELGKKYGLEFIEHLNVSGKQGTPDHKTPIKYLVLDLPVRRQSQNLVKKISVPDDNKVVDELTYQPTGDSKGAKISYPELQVLTGMGLDNCISELIKYRGGDRGGFNAYTAMTLRYGSANLKTLEGFATGVESTKTLKTYLLSAHINNNI